MFKTRLLSFILIFSSTPSLAHIFGTYDRVDTITPLEAEKRQIGRIWKPNGKSCTAVLVGPKLVLTSRYCIYYDPLNIVNVEEGLHFRLGVAGQYNILADSDVISYIHGGADSERDPTPTNFPDKGNWALLEINKNLGDEFGYFKIANKHQIEKWSDQLTLTGYNQITLSTTVLNHNNEVVPKYIKTSKYFQQTQSQCSIREKYLDNSVVSHDCDSMAGDAGSPLYKCEVGSCYIIALHNSDEKKLYGSVHSLYQAGMTRNNATLATEFREHVLKLNLKE